MGGHRLKIGFGVLWMVDHVPKVGNRALKTGGIYKSSFTFFLKTGKLRVL